MSNLEQDNLDIAAGDFFPNKPSDEELDEATKDQVDLDLSENNLEE